jgi:hypothetical protein
VLRPQQLTMGLKLRQSKIHLYAYGTVTNAMDFWKKHWNQVTVRGHVLNKIWTRQHTNMESGIVCET